MNTRFLETLVWLSKLKSFSRTAEKLHTSQPAVSGRIAALEDLLGVALYERQSKRFELTPAGRRIIERCANIVEQTKDIKRLVYDDDFLARPLRIGSADIVTLTWLRSFIDAAKHEYGQIEFEFITDSGSHLAKGLLSDNIDLAFVVEGVEDTRVHNAPLCYYKVDWLAAHSAYPDGRLSVRDLCEMSIITPPHDTSGFRWLSEFFKRHNPGYDPENPGRHRLQCGYSPATTLEMVALGLGVAAIPTLLARPRIFSGEVAILDVEEKFPSWSVVAAHKSPPTISKIPDLVKLAQDQVTQYCKHLEFADVWP